MSVVAGVVDAGTALSSEAVDAQFWALVCDDEEWPETGSAGAPSGPAESPTRVRRRTMVLVDRVRPERPTGPGSEAGRPAPGRSGPADGAWRRQRSPPLRPA